MKDIVIVCAGAFGQEVYWEITYINLKADRLGQERPYHILGFLSDVPDALDGVRNIDAKIIGPIKGWKPKGDEVYIIGLSKPAQKRTVGNMLKENGARFESIVSVNARVPEDLEMGEGCFITGGAMVGYGVKLGSFVNVNCALLYPGAVIGDYSTTTGFTVVEEARVGEGVFVGSKAVITEGTTVGDWSNVAAGSVVTEDVRPGVTVFGMPAQEMA